MKFIAAIPLFAFVAACGPIPLPPPIWPAATLTHQTEPVSPPGENSSTPAARQPTAKLLASKSMVSESPQASRKQATSSEIPPSSAVTSAPEEKDVQRPTLLAQPATPAVGPKVNAETARLPADPASAQPITALPATTTEPKSTNAESETNPAELGSSAPPVTQPNPSISPAQTQFQIAQALFRQGHFYQAATVLEKQPDHAPSQTLLLAAYEKLIHVLLRNGQLEEAKQLLSRATLVNPMAESLIELRTRLEHQYAASQQNPPTQTQVAAPPKASAKTPTKSVRLGDNAQPPLSPAHMTQTQNTQIQSQPTMDTATIARIQALHDAAELALGRHEFDSAVNNWRQVLDLQSSNPSAREGILRVQQLKEKLSQIK